MAITKDKIYGTIKDAIVEILSNKFGIASPIAKRYIANKADDLMESDAIKPYMKYADFILFDKNGNLDIDGFFGAVRDEINVAGLKVKGIDIKEEWVKELQNKLHSMTD